MLITEIERDEVELYPVAGGHLLVLPMYALGVECGGSTTGFASPADDYIETHLDLNHYHDIKRHACFLVRAFGDSMSDAGIQENDLLIVDTGLDYRENDIVVCSINGSYKAKVIRREEEKLYLVSRNPQFAPIEISEFDDVRVFGVVKGFSRNFRK
ncbi:MAG: translesion error-prone DNA polymerase V autoproteolytic subunit [Cytophagaceae bacterium]|nr:translesion error-prone DNA polymerase V autoproteolytic subunit [Cytophagaceae bacterium]